MALDRYSAEGAVGLRTEQELHDWMEQAPAQVSTAIAHRAVMRILPFAFIVDEPSDALDRQLLGTLRATMTAGLAARMPSAVPEEVARKAAVMAGEMAELEIPRTGPVDLDAVDDTARAGAAYAAEAAAQSILRGPKAARAAVTFAAQTASAAAAGYDPAYFAVLEGAYADAALPADKLAVAPIKRPKMLADMVDLYRTGRVSVFPGGVWRFWAAWFDGAVTGEPMSWYLQRLVVNVPEKYWRNSPESVARQIDEARARIEVISTVRCLEAVLAGERLSEVEDDEEPDDRENVAASFAAVKLLKDPLDTIVKQTQSAQPQPFLVGKAVKKLSSVEIGVAHWMGKSMDPKAKEYAQAIGKAGGLATAHWLNDQAEHLRAVIVASKHWMRTLG